ncbi:DUF3090 family protein [SAR202 cluster bacterium AD-804-J14_MRT_500m]|nr:DUF3090 family protein [SAR202 cluster bacterium AD-804-J14_MRT_500m]
MPDYRAYTRLGIVDSVMGESQGRPGERTFRLLIRAGLASASLWLEKEQLQQLATYIQDASSNPSRGDPNETDSPEETWNGEATNIDFKVGSLALGHDSASNSFLFLAHETEADPGGPADISFWVPFDMAQELSKKSLEICAAGRPNCVLCGRPMNPDGHMCVRSNGHQSFKT